MTSAVYWGREASNQNKTNDVACPKHYKEGKPLTTEITVLQNDIILDSGYRNDPKFSDR